VEFRSSSLPDPVLDARRSTLEDRLEDGYHRIDQAVLSGADVSEWESFWLRLLGEYEDVCRELDQAA
jgi:iron uptake system EfeUOB component EfeO/EfeM